MSNETDRLTELCVRWGSRVEDETIPEESECKPEVAQTRVVSRTVFTQRRCDSVTVRDRMRTAVGQARLLIKERFNQFRGLVDDCELSRGEKVTTCTDLQGFWDMVYFQVRLVRWGRLEVVLDSNATA